MKARLTCTDCNTYMFHNVRSEEWFLDKIIRDDIILCNKTSLNNSSYCYVKTNQIVSIEFKY